MSRGLTTALQNAIAGDGFVMATLFRMELTSTLYLTDYPRNLTYGTSIYIPSPHLIEIGDANESTELQVNDFTLTLSGVEQSFIAAFLNNKHYTDNKVVIYKAIVNQSTDALIGAFMIFDGRIAGYAIEDDDKTSTIEIELASHWADFEKEINRKTNNNSQQFHFPGDKGFEFASKTVKDLRWGRK